MFFVQNEAIRNNKKDCSVTTENSGYAWEQLFQRWHEDVIYQKLSTPLLLDGRIEFPELFKRKRRHAPQTGEIYMKYQDMIG